jgi:hypothetical protein
MGQEMKGKEMSGRESKGRVLLNLSKAKLDIRFYF